ncbi:MAG: cyclase family protein [Clostridia bacterium]|nr:cyclase family protein [Clostridia bacterium]
MKIKRILDVSRKIHPGMTVWPGDEGVEIRRLASMNNQDACNLSAIHMGAHSGTHIDAPFHFIPNGKTVESLDLSRFFGPVKVLDLTHLEGCIKEEDLRLKDISSEELLLFKTKNSFLPEEDIFYKEYVYLHESAARFLIQKSVKTVGFDYLSVDKYKGGGHPVHELLLSKEIAIIEGLLLKEIEEGTYFLSCLPLKIEGIDGCPVRAVLAEIAV